MDATTLELIESEGEKRGLVPRFLDFYKRLAILHSEVEARARNEGKPSCIDFSSRIASGIPLVTFDEFGAEWNEISGTYCHVRALFADYTDIFGRLPAGLGASPPLSLPDICRAWFEGSNLPDCLGSITPEEGLIVQAILQATLKPFLGARKLDGFDMEQWRRPYCPVCGGLPDFASLKKDVGARWLLCARCDTEWLFQRLQCPYCGCGDQNALAYLTDEKGIYRLYVCERCHSYLKAVDLRKDSPSVPLPFHRFLTLDIDRQAQEKGYHPGHMATLKA